MIITYESVVEKIILLAKENAIQEVFGSEYKNSKSFNAIWDFVFEHIANREIDVAIRLFTMNLQILKDFLEKE